MELTLQTFLIVCPLVFLGGFVDSVAGGAGIITIPAYLMAGIPVHLAAGTNKLVNGSGTLVATLKYIKSGKVVWRPALLAGVGALLKGAETPAGLGRHPGQRHDGAGEQQYQQNLSHCQISSARHWHFIVTSGTSISCSEMPPCWKVPV